MFTEKQLKIIEVFRKNLDKDLTFNEIKKSAELRSNSFLQITLKKCVEEGVVSTRNVGKTILYNLILNDRTYAYFSLINYELYDLPLVLLGKIRDEIASHTQYFTLVVFGSYAEKENQESSDLDVAIIVGDKKIKGAISIGLKSLERREIKKIDYHIFNKKEFAEMLAAKKENVGKEIARHNLVFVNPAVFYGILEGAR